MDEFFTKRPITSIYKYIYIILTLSILISRLMSLLIMHQNIYYILNVNNYKLL